MGSSHHHPSLQNQNSKNPLIHSYFTLINQYLSSNSNSNLKNPSNLLYSLDRKMFDPFKLRRTTIKKKDDKYIPWIDYLTNYLSSKSFSYVSWCANLLERIKKENFGDEIRYHNLFHYKEFYIRTFPSCLKDLVNNIPKLDLSLTQKFPFSSNSKNGSLDYQFKEKRDKIKAYIYTFKEHIGQKIHPINIIIVHFEHIFTNYIQREIDKTECHLMTNSKKDYLDLLDKITSELRGFILTLQVCLKLMYFQDINYDIFKEEKDEVINLITNQIFNTGEICACFLNLCSMGLKEKERDFELKLIEFKNIEPEDLGIKKQFCLKEEINSNNTQEKESDKKLLNDNNEKEIKIIEGENPKKNNDIPYLKAIKQLEKLYITKSPLEKLIIMSMINEAISKCINSFWSKQNEEINKSLLVIDADEIITIMIYILIKGQNPKILINLKLIDLFTTNITKSTLGGYYFSLIDAAAQYILKLKNIDDLIEKGRLKREKYNKTKG